MYQAGWNNKQCALQLRSFQMPLRSLFIKLTFLHNFQTKYIVVGAEQFCVPYVELTDV
jgi:hypothetical protein